MTAVQINKDNTKLFGGKYTEAKAKLTPVRCHGEVARKMDSEHYHEAVATLLPSLKTYSPFAKGLGVMVTKLDDSVAAGDTLVQLTINRTPMDEKLGIQSPESVVKVTEDHVVALNGGSTGKAGVAPQITAAGFESKCPPIRPPIRHFVAVCSTWPHNRCSCRVCDQDVHGRRRALAGEDHSRRWVGRSVRGSAGPARPRDKSR